MLIKSYKKQLLELAFDNHTVMKKAYRLAGIPYSSYHRNFKTDPEVEITLSNANKIANKISELSTELALAKIRKSGMSVSYTHLTLPTNREV